MQKRLLKLFFANGTYTLEINRQQKVITVGQANQITDYLSFPKVFPEANQVRIVYEAYQSEIEHILTQIVFPFGLSLDNH